jgi:hypothetical protein
MGKLLLLFALLATAAGAGAAVFAHGSEAAAAAAIQRTFVSTAGSDSNPCTRAAPCRNFQAAMANTLAGGEVVALDSGGYGPVSIGMAVTIVGAPGVHAAVTATSGDAIHVAAGAGDTVILRNLYLNGLGATNGVNYVSGRALHLEQLTSSGFDLFGVNHEAPNGRLYGSDLVLRRNAVGVRISPPSGTAPVTLERVRADDNSFAGISGIQNARLRISGCSVAGGQYGVTVAVPTMVSGCRLSENSFFGLQVGGGATAQIGDSTVTFNTVGLQNDGGTLESFGDNLVRGNTTNTSGTITTVAKT